MTFHAGNNEAFEVNMDIVTKAIRAVVKAVSEDVPNELRENNLETNNRIGGLRGDWINQNLRDLLPECGTLHPFSRYGWRGRIIVDHENKTTYSITTRATLLSIWRKHRSTPHFLQTLLMQENHALYGRYEQTSLFDMSQFEPSIYEKDFDNIFYGTIDPEDGYRHLVICYEAAKNEVVSATLLFLSPSGNVVSEIDLDEYRKPDFSMLTSDDESTEYSVVEHNEATRNLIKIKQNPTLPKIKEQEHAKES